MICVSLAQAIVNGGLGIGVGIGEGVGVSVGTGVAVGDGTGVFVGTGLGFVWFMTTATGEVLTTGSFEGRLTAGSSGEGVSITREHAHRKIAMHRIQINRLIEKNTGRFANTQRPVILMICYAFIWDMTSSAKLSSRFCRPSPIS